MTIYFDNNLKNIRSISRFTFWGSIFLMMNTILFPKFDYANLRTTLVFFGLFAFFIYWMIPVFFLLIKKQVFAIAWSKAFDNWEDFKNNDFKTLKLSDKILMIMNCIVACVGLLLFTNVLSYALMQGS